ncbi:MAG: twin transmembrane helix small protein [Alphaproteobacteria bacterium]
MSIILPMMILLALLSVLAVLGLGLFSMMKGGEFNEKYGNKLMRLRVMLQGLTILLLVISFYLSQN